jgi:putative tryptophan/tyrosine transport system substrate-binding protein
MRRRQFISVAVGTAAAWPLRVRAQQPPRPVIGLVGSATARQWAPFVAAFMQGLSETGIVEGQTVAIEYRWAEGVSSIDCRPWQPIWSNAMCPSLPP